ncbi:MAG TPA: sugar ABC transporter substrate-binding protein, partial [Spirochaetia bacterium]|nr:sugar ABC transporter substrate-binding protein [Spirochaetia bacterium]
NMTAEFQKLNPQVTVSPEYVPYEALHDKIVTAAASGSGYDIVLFDVIWPAEFANQGILRDITNDIPKSMIDQVFAGAWESSRYKNHYYGVPWILDTQYLFYNTEMLQKAGIKAPPKTLAELADQAKILKQKGIVQYPIIWAWQQSENVFLNYAQVFFGFGGTWFDTKNNPTFNSGGGLKALEYMVQTIKDGTSNPASLQAIADDEVRIFGAGQAAFAINWTYMYNVANTDASQSTVVGKVGIVPAPGDGRNASIVPLNGSMGLGITQSCKNPREALSYISYLASAPVQAKYAALNLPMWKPYYDNPSQWPKGQDALMKAAKAAFTRLYDRPLLSNYTQFSTIMQKYLQQALLLQVSPKEALDAAAKEVVQEGANQ